MTTEVSPSPALGASARAVSPASRLRALVFDRADLIGLVILAVALAGYLFNLGGWLITDDEGSYLYQSWRVSLGETPYRDFLTPQLPLFLGVGGLVQAVFGVSPVPLRALSVVLVLGAGWALYRVLRRYMSAGLALVGMAGFLAHPDVYAVGRVYRPEAYMLFFIGVGLWLFVVAEERRSRTWLALAGVFFGLAMLTKLFATLALAGVGLYVLARGEDPHPAQRQDPHPSRRGEDPHPLPGGEGTSDPLSPWERVRVRVPWRDLLTLGAPAALVAGGVMALFLLAVPETWAAVFGHQLMQGSQLSRGEVLSKGVAFYGVYFAKYAPLLVFALPMAVEVWRRGGRWTLLAWQVPTVIAFVLLSRELWPRHLVYLAPALVGLWAASLEPMRTWAGRGFLLAAIVGAIILPWVFEDRILAFYSEQGTWRLADFMAAEVGPDGSFLADYPEINYYARRPTGYAAASLSQGAASSGQTTGARLARELDAMGGNAVVVELSDFSQIRFLRDRPEFLSYLDQNFRPLGIFHRNHQTYQVYRRRDAAPSGPELNFGQKLTLFNGGLSGDSVASGGTTEVGLRFGVRAPALEDRERPPLSEDYIAFLHLKDAEGLQWGSGDGALKNSLGKLTSGWLPGELNADRFDLRVRPGTRPGVYSVVVGVYRRENLSRLDILNTQGNPVGTEARLAEITVTPPARPPAPSELGLAQALDAGLGPARLVGVSLDRPGLEAGDSVRVELGWQVPTVFDGKLALALQGSGGATEAQTVDLALPTGVWLSQHNLLADADTPGGDYSVTAQLLSADGRPLGEAAPVARLTVRPVATVFERPALGRPLQVTLGDRVDLDGYDLAAETVRPGAPVALTLVWRPRGRLQQSLKVFTHLVATDERIVGQSDSVPVGGGRPTTGWRPGEWIVDRYTIPTPANLAPGRYELRVGLYDEATGERLPVEQGGAPQAGGYATLGPVEVRP